MCSRWHSWALAEPELVSTSVLVIWGKIRNVHSCLLGKHMAEQG